MGGVHQPFRQRGVGRGPGAKGGYETVRIRHIWVWFSNLPERLEFPGW